MVCRAVLLLLLVSLPSQAMAEIFSCTDKDGGKHVADTLMRLPAECRNQAETLELQNKGDVNYVPAPKQPTHQGRTFEEAVSEVTGAQQRKTELAQELLERATIAASAFTAAQLERRSEIRTKRAGFRERIKAADSVIENSRREKENLVKELGQANLKREDRQAIEVQLGKIE